MTLAVLALDVDGVLTDGGVYLTEQGEEMLRFSVMDGMGITRWIGAGRRCVWVSARKSPAAAIRARRLGVNDLLLGVSDKVEALDAFLRREGYGWHQVVYVGDDLVDLEPLRRSGYAVAVATAVPEVRQVAHYTTARPGGRGAVREVVDMILARDTDHHHEVAQETSTSARSLGHAPDDRRR